MRVLLQSEIAVVTQEGNLIRAARTSVPFGTGEKTKALVETLTHQFRAGLPLRERKGLMLLIDTRLAPLAPLDEQQNPILPLLSEMTSGFPRVAVLVQTAVGLLQANRRAREQSFFGHPSLSVFNDEAAALSFLRGEDPALSSKPPTGNFHRK